MPTQLNNAVQECIDELVADGREVGLQVAAYVDGKQVVDAWAGVADEASGRPVEGETLFTSWSTTKGFVATCIHLLVEQGKLHYDAPIAAYWPEFAAHGKGHATVLDALTHRIGVPQMPDNLTPEMLTDWETMCNAIADLGPLWEPGTKTGYHAFTIGWILGEIVRRVDGRPIERFVQDELCRPLGIDSFYLGIPPLVTERMATLRTVQALTDYLKGRKDLIERGGPAHVINADVLNRPDIRAAVIPGGGGIMNARAIARHYAMLAAFGELEGVRLLARQRVEMMRTCQTDEHDLVLNFRLRKGMGYFLGGAADEGGMIAMGSSGSEFGFSGFGGSLGFADPAHGFAFGLTKNLLNASPVATEATAYVVADLIRKQLGWA